MRQDYSAPDIDTSFAQRVAAAQEETLANFVAPRTAGGAADSTFTFGARAARPSSGIQGDRYYANDVGTRGGWLYMWNGTSWEIVVGWASGTNAVRAAITPAAVDDGAWFYATDTWKIWEVSGGAWVDRFVSLDVTTSYKVAATKVIGAQGAAVPDATGGATVDAEARTAINDLLARLRAHGLIA